jgi:hypothetical protein
MRLAALATLLLLTGCSGSGFWAYERNTLTLPGANPHMPVSSSENFLRSRGAVVPEPTPQLTEAGDIWPGPPAPVPTLKDLQKQQMAEINNASSGALAPLPPLPSLPGYEISEQETFNPIPPPSLSNVKIPGRRGVAVPPSLSVQLGDSAGTGPIIVPNGNGTSTVISPSGAVTTIPTPKTKTAPP